MTLWDACGNRLWVVVEPADDERLSKPNGVARHCFFGDARVADGVAWFAPRDDHFRMAFYNPDGTPERLCGNGLLVAARTLAHRSRATLRPFDHPEVEVEHASDSVAASASVPLHRFVRPQTPHGSVFDTGSPHLVIERGDVSDFDLAAFARPLVETLDVNVSVYALRAGVAVVRTFERGVNAETLACGTGALAVAFAAGKRVEVRYPGGSYVARAECAGSEVRWTLSASADRVRRG